MSEEELEVSETKVLPVFLIVFFLGPLGIHRFFVGKIGTGVLHLLTLGALGIWTFIDLIFIVLGKFKDKEGKVIKNWS